MGVSCSSFARGRRGSSAPSGATGLRLLLIAEMPASTRDAVIILSSPVAFTRLGGMAGHNRHIFGAHIGSAPGSTTSLSVPAHGTAAVQSKADETGPQIRDPGAFRLELELRGRRRLRTRRTSRPPRPQTPSSDALALDQHARPGADRQRVGVHVQHDPWANCWSIACLA
jgi:hypothetical protein